MRFLVYCTVIYFGNHFPNHYMVHLLLAYQSPVFILYNETFHTCCLSENKISRLFLLCCKKRCNKRFEFIDKCSKEVPCYTDRLFRFRIQSRKTSKTLKMPLRVIPEHVDKYIFWNTPLRGSLSGEPPSIKGYKQKHWTHMIMD